MAVNAGCRCMPHNGPLRALWCSVPCCKECLTSVAQAMATSSSVEIVHLDIFMASCLR